MARKMKDPKKLWQRVESKLGSVLMITRLPKEKERVLLQFGSSPLTWGMGLYVNGGTIARSAKALGVRAYISSYPNTGAVFDSLEDAVAVALHASGVEKKRPREVARLLILAKAFDIYIREDL